MLEILPKMSQKFPEKISKNTENLQKEFLKPLLKNSQRNCWWSWLRHIPNDFFLNKSLKNTGWNRQKNAEGISKKKKCKVNTEAGNVSRLISKEVCKTLLKIFPKKLWMGYKKCLKSFGNFQKRAISKRIFKDFQTNCWRNSKKQC